jgi:NAD(P)H-hydrate repair Nnr-like enzyme with NAD(P)H-hydrate dehydratase domain
MPMSTRAERTRAGDTRAGRTRAVPVTPTLLRGWPLPGGGSGKDDRGSVLVIGGARTTPGAALLAGLAALRSGAGRLMLAVAESTAVQLAVALPEAGVTGLPETPGGSVLGSGASALGHQLAAADAILVGPGLDDAGEATALLRELLRPELAGGHPPEGKRDGKQSGKRGGKQSGNSGGSRTPIILDAYALGSLPGLRDELGPWAGRLILTPNITEAGILLGRDVGELHRDVAAIAAEYGAVVTCQGVIAGEDGLWEITTGHSGLGTSGSGDVLAGVIAGLRARGTTDAQAACWGTHLHAAAGDRLASRLGGLGYLARELTEELPPLMMELGT